MKRVVVFTGELSYTVRRSIVELARRLPAGSEWLVLEQRRKRTLAEQLRAQRANLRKHGWRWAAHLCCEVLKRLGPKPAGDQPPSADAPGGEFEMQALLALPGLRHEIHGDLHGGEALAAVRGFAPDLGLSLAAPILKPRLFNLPALGTINLHKGRLPDFRGMPPAFWELWTGAARVGCSVHRVNEALDEGDLLAQAEVACEPFSSPRGVQVRLDEIGVSLVNQVALRLLEGESMAALPQHGPGRTWRKPTLAQEAEMRRRLRKRQPNALSLPVQALKDVWYTWARKWHTSLAWRWRTPRVTVLLYHRVSDAARDNLTVGVEQFERQLKLLRRHARLLSVRELLEMREIPRSRLPWVALSFDDGYADNHAYAAPLLRRHRLPCAFYVSTGLVERNGRFPHDVRRGNPHIPVMTWDQVRDLQAWGFDVGSHTVEHIDCVAQPEERVRAELAQSLSDLQRELGARERDFAYPYGGRHQMNERVRGWVREQGYRSCLSAYGGSNVGSVDRWNVLRRGIHCDFSDAAFLAETLGQG